MPGPWTEYRVMTLVKVQSGGLLAVPEDARRQLRVDDGDYLDLKVEDGVLTLRPVARMDRQEAWRRLREIQASVRYIGPEPRPSPEEEERWIFDVLAEDDERRA
jgi:bifunctional DNA-binding transcriptional regulator/antitoxin component of YhaV-PrlF toxin-antitoxin module